MTTPFELTVSKVIPAPAKTVFEAWLDPEALSSFMRPGDKMDKARVTVDAREGGDFEIVMLAGDVEVPCRGQYSTIKKYERLAFTWLSAHSNPDSVVTLSFKELGPSETEVTLHHVGFPSQESRDNHEQGWSLILDLSGTAVS